MNYKFVIFGAPDELPKFAYSDLYDMQNVTYIPGIRSKLNFFLYILFRIHTMNPINRYIRLPFKNKWAKIIMNKIPIIQGTDTTNVYIFERGWPEYEKDIQIINFIKRKNNNAKFILFLEDLFGTYKIHDYKHSPLMLDFVKSMYDFVISFDQGDCDKYGFKYHPLVFSSFHGKIENLPISDVYFIGLAKNRLSEIIKTYEVLKKGGLICDFHIVGVKKNDRMYENEIDYDPKINYTQNIQHVLHSKCILEIMQVGGIGYTQRACEAVGLGKLLLTNNNSIDKAPFYNPQFIFKFNSPNEISKDIINQLKESPFRIDFGYKEKLSPKEFLNFIINQF